MNPLEEAAWFGGFALAHGAWIASDLNAGELICPIAIVESGEERRVIPFESATQAESIERGKASLAELKDSVNRWALVREGFYCPAGVDEAKQDAITVSSWVRGLDEPILLQQLFQPAAAGKFALLADVFLGVHGYYLQGEPQERLRESVMGGVRSHPHGARWAQWLGTPHRLS